MASEGGKGGGKPGTDWEAIEREYRGGQISEAEIARRHSVSRTAIQKRAKKRGWKRDLTDKVRAEIAARLVAEGLQVPRDAATVDQMADRGVGLILSHRVDIRENRAAVTELIAELRETLRNLDDIEEAVYEETEAPDGEAESKGAEQARLKRRQRMLAAIALPSRAQVAGTLAAALKTLIPLERQAFNIDDKGAPPDGSDGNPVNVIIDAASAERLKRLVE